MRKYAYLSLFFLSFIAQLVFSSHTQAGALEFLNKANKLVEEKEKLTKTVNDTLDGKSQPEDTGSSVEGLAEPDILEIFPNSQLKAHNLNDLTRTVLPLTANLRGDDSNYRKLKLTGEQEIYIYTVPENISKSYLKVFNALKQNAQDAQIELLWQCDSAEDNCGYFFPRQFVFKDRGEDASKTYKSFRELTNFNGSHADFAIYTGRTKIKKQSYFVTVIAGKAYGSGPVQYSIEIVKADDPLPATKAVENRATNETTESTANNTATTRSSNAILKTYPGSKLKAQHTNDLTRVTLPLSANLRDNKDSYKKLKLTGEQSVKIYTVPDTATRSYLKVFTKLHQDLVKAGAKVLWQCDTADKNCGYYFTRKFLFDDRGADASRIFEQLGNIKNYDGGADYAITTAKLDIKGKTHFVMIIVGKYATTTSPVEYAYEIVKADDPGVAKN